ncbi:MAG: response regulator transcription factor [Flavobacteriales bacterium]|nr:response regulator transcription factor [Flavobacteriales bacterium]
MNNIRTLVVDDEPAARARILRMLERDQDLRVIAECRNGQEAIEVLVKEPIDLVFMDIQMPHANGFEVLEASRKEPRPFVVFVTAHDRYALKAFDVNAVDYLLKPYDEERFYTSLSKAKEFIEMRTSKNLAGKLIDIVQQHVRSQKDFAEEITIKEKGRSYQVKYKDVLFVRAESNYLILQLKDKHFLLRMTLNMLESEVDPKQFVRIHRSYIVNMKHVRGARYSGNNEFVFTMSNGQHILSGRSCRDKVSAVLSSGQV